MRFDFGGMEEMVIENFKGGEGCTIAKMGMIGNDKFMLVRLPAGSTIGRHKHETNTEVQFFISGKGVAYCDGREEIVGPGVCHVCPKGSYHEVVNTGDDDLVMYCCVIDC